MEPMVTVFRSADPGADSQASRVAEKLREAGLDAEIAADDQPGVIVGAIEVRVPMPQREAAEAIVASGIEQALGDASHALDLVSVFRSQSLNAEAETLAVRALLDASGIPSVLFGSTQIPSLPFEVQVPRSLQLEAARVLAEAREAGPEAAEEAEEAGEAE